MSSFIKRHINISNQSFGSVRGYAHEKLPFDLFICTMKYRYKKTIEKEQCEKTVPLWGGAVLW